MRTDLGLHRFVSVRSFPENVSCQMHRFRLSEVWRGPTRRTARDTLRDDDDLCWKQVKAELAQTEAAERWIHTDV